MTSAESVSRFLISKRIHTLSVVVSISSKYQGLSSVDFGFIVREENRPRS